MTNDNLKRIESGLRIGYYKNNPHVCADDLSILAGEYSWMCGQLEDILVTKPSYWNSKRAEVKSDTACEKAWEMTEAGINETGLRLRLKGVEKMMSALKSLLRLAEQEAKNIM